MLAALFLPGLPRVAHVPRKRGPLVESVLRRFTPGESELGDCLRENGLWFEAQVLESSQLKDEAARFVSAGIVLSCACPGYPARWRSALGDSAPPAIWCSADFPSGACYSVVGSRQVPLEGRKYSREAGRAVARAGGVLVSGGASGCDSEAASGALSEGGSVVEILPYGFGAGRIEAIPGKCFLSVAPWNAGFSAALAMERNALIYAASERSLVAAVRFREGGTWNGAVQAMRRGLSQFFVRDVQAPGHQALINLGAHRVSSPDEFILSELRLSPSLFAV